MFSVQRLGLPRHCLSIKQEVQEIQMTLCQRRQLQWCLQTARPCSVSRVPVFRSVSFVYLLKAFAGAPDKQS